MLHIKGRRMASQTHTHTHTGTTHGLLAHSDNDVGTLGSLPMRADTNLLESWCEELRDRNVRGVRARSVRVSSLHHTPRCQKI